MMKWKIILLCAPRMFIIFLRWYQKKYPVFSVSTFKILVLWHFYDCINQLYLDLDKTFVTGAGNLQLKATLSRNWHFLVIYCPSQFERRCVHICVTFWPLHLNRLHRSTTLKKKRSWGSGSKTSLASALARTSRRAWRMESSCASKQCFQNTVVWWPWSSIVIMYYGLDL